MLTITQIESDPAKKKEIDLIEVLRSFGALCAFADVDPLPKSSIKSLLRAYWPVEGIRHLPQSRHDRRRAQGRG